MMASSDQLARYALVAVELVDPVTLETVTRGMAVTAEGLNGSPVMTLSGRFAWYSEGDAWPTRFLVDPGARPYEREVVAAPGRPPRPDKPQQGEVRLVLVTLRPTAAYPFTEGLTVVRGRLRERPESNAAPVEDAEIWLRWQTASTFGSPMRWLDAPTRARTNRAGDFAAILRLPVPSRPGSEMNASPLKARIAVSRNGQTREQPDDLTEWKIHPLPEGHLYDLPEALAWSELFRV